MRVLAPLLWPGLRRPLEKKMRPEQAQIAIEEFAAKAGAVLDSKFCGIANK